MCLIKVGMPGFVMPLDMLYFSELHPYMSLEYANKMSVRISTATILRMIFQSHFSCFNCHCHLVVSKTLDYLSYPFWPSTAVFYGELDHRLIQGVISTFNHKAKRLVILETVGKRLLGYGRPKRCAYSSRKLW